MLFLNHTPLFEVPPGPGRRGPHQERTRLLFLQFLFFYTKLTDLYSNKPQKTGCKIRIAAHHFCSKSLFCKGKAQHV